MGCCYADGACKGNVQAGSVAGIGGFFPGGVGMTLGMCKQSIIVYVGLISSGPGICGTGLGIRRTTGRANRLWIYL